ncbi:MAG: Uma2 family endonuclease [Acidobacteria bacterium]|nr:Uma2 family endonuclease [Acidobacteriota bacterium]MYK89060.1 Uma2 family endonuclease [Acidobacteriota bacterium]
MIQPAPAAVPIHYPSSDGKPMAENDAQRSAIMYGIGALMRHFRERRDVYVSGDLLLYYEEGNPRVSIAPDVFVVFGVEKRERLNYKLWEEGRAPSFVLEVASRSTWRDDLGRKRSVYARLGVSEYWQYDPTGEYLPARLQGERLTRSGYVRQPALTAPDGALTLRSRTLALELRAAPGREMRFRDPATGDDLRSHDEEAAGRLTAETRVAAAETRAAAAVEDRATESAARLAAEARATAAEARVAELEALLRKRSG